MKNIYKIIILLFTITLTFSSCESLTYDENIQKGDEAYQSFLLQDNYDKKISYKEKAISYYSNAIDIDPGSVNAYMKRANIYGQSYLAIDDYSKVIELNPDNAEAYMKRANSYMPSIGYTFGYQILESALENLDLAIDDYNKFIELNPDNAEAYWQRGKLKLFTNREYISVVYPDGYTTEYGVLSDESIQDFIKAMEIDISYFEDNNAIYMNY